MELRELPLGKEREEVQTEGDGSVWRGGEVGKGVERLEGGVVGLVGFQGTGAEGVERAKLEN